MFIKNRRFSKLVVVFLIFTMIFSFNTVFAGVAHTCTYPDALAGKTISDSGSIAGNDNGILPELGVEGNKIQFPGIGVIANSEASGPPATSVRVTFTTGTEAHFEVVSGAVNQINVKTANNYKILTFSPSMQAGDCVTLSTAGLGTSASGNLKEFSHITWYVGEEVKGSIEIEKVYTGLAQDETSPTATFELYKADKTTIVQGNIKLPDPITKATSFKLDNLALGSYYLKETSVPTGFVLDSVKIGSSVLASDNGFYGPIQVNSSATVTVTATNAKLGSITIAKSYSDESTTAKATFQLWTYDGSNFNKYGSEIEITGGDSETIPDLPPANYYLTETTNPPIYTLGAFIGADALASTNGYFGPISVGAGTLVTVNAENTKLDLGSIAISKSYSPTLGSEDTVSAVFQLYTDEAGTIPAKDVYGNIAKVTINGASTTPLVIDNMKTGTYYLGESGTLGYTLALKIDGVSKTANDYGLYVVTIDEDQQVIAVSAVNTKTEDKGSIEITKQWNVDANTSGYSATFELYTHDGTQYNGYPTSQNPIILTLDTSNSFTDATDQIPVGTYFIKETGSNPNGFALTGLYINGSTTSETALAGGYYRINLTKDIEGSSIAIVAENSQQYGGFAVKKVYSGGTTSSYPSATFHLWEKTSDGYVELTNLGSPFILNDGQTQSFPSIPVGAYYLSEEVPSGYTLTMQGLSQVDGKYIINVTNSMSSDTQQLVTYTALNSFNPPPPPPPPGKVSIQLNKQYTSITTGTNPTAIFFLYSKNGNLYTDVSGMISIQGAGTQTISNLDPGTYYLQESSMEGYALDSVTIDGTKVVKENDGYYKIQATTAGTTVSVTALNSPPLSPPPPEDQEVDEELPMTGGNTIAFLLSGGVLTALGILVRRFQK